MTTTKAISSHKFIFGFMKITRLLTAMLFIACFAVQAQSSANRFYYEFSYKPKKDSAIMEKVMTILDVTDDKSIFRDYTLVAQDSIIQAKYESMKKTGVFVDLTKTVNTNKISYKIYKYYPSMRTQYVESIMGAGFAHTNVAYSENIHFEWKLTGDKGKVGEYNVQKATTEFGGRKWIAWFSENISFSDGPYKFFGLPGLIVKIQDVDNNFTWLLKGNKKVDNFNEVSYAEKITQRGDSKIHDLPKEKFNSTFEKYKKDPLGSVRHMLTPQLLGQKMQGSDITLGDMIRSQEKIHKDLYMSSDNNIEITK